ncbi:alpha/beta hydrolase fold-domain-containing protein [Amylocystis lapponica]|nr:alpha/beta hydrolase fold-domain-containing protein [Amylocystis lapponica]
MSTPPQKIWQPIPPALLPRLLPEYAAFHIANTQHKPNGHQVPWDPAVRLGPPVEGGSEPLKCASVKDFPLSKCNVRVYTPDGTPPEAGWPVFIFYHGGGWTLGSISTEAAITTNMCQRAHCVVVNVDYRLGPEIPYPAAVEDAVESLHWVHEQGAALLGINPGRIAVGGSSSGGNLAAVVTHKAALAEPPIPLVFQLLFVPVTDNTADPSGVPYKSWIENANTISLVPDKMMWFRRNYLPNEADWPNWDNSPIFAPEETFKKAPNAFIAVCELDVLRDEGIAYGEKLKQAGVDVELHVYKGCPHPIVAMDGASSIRYALWRSSLTVLLRYNYRRSGVLEVGKRLLTDAAKALAKGLGTEYSD